VLRTVAIWFIRLWGVAVALVYAAFVVTTGSLWTSSEEWMGPVLFPFLVAAAVFAFAVLDAGEQAASHAPQAIAWCVMVAGTFVVVSFASLLVPLLITAAPAAFARPRLGT